MNPVLNLTVEYASFHYLLLRLEKHDFSVITTVTIRGLILSQNTWKADAVVIILKVWRSIS